VLTAKAVVMRERRVIRVERMSLMKGLMKLDRVSARISVEYKKNIEESNNLYLPL
jgi:hypothetical protein